MKQIDSCVRMSASLKCYDVHMSIAMYLYIYLYMYLYMYIYMYTESFVDEQNRQPPLISLVSQCVVYSYLSWPCFIQYGLRLLWQPVWHEWWYDF